MLLYPNPCVELSGWVLSLGIARQVSKLIWLRELVIAVKGHDEPGEGEVKIDFTGQYMALLDEVGLDDLVRVRCTIRGVSYEWNGEAKHSVKLIGRDIEVQPPPGKSRKAAPEPREFPFAEASGRKPAKSRFGSDPVRRGHKINETPVPFPKSSFAAEPFHAPAEFGAISNPVGSGNKINEAPEPFPKANTHEEPPF